MNTPEWGKDCDSCDTNFTVTFQNSFFYALILPFCSKFCSSIGKSNMK